MSIILPSFAVSRCRSLSCRARVYSARSHFGCMQLFNYIPGRKADLRFPWKWNSLLTWGKGFPFPPSPQQSRNIAYSFDIFLHVFWRVSGMTISEGYGHFREIYAIYNESLATWIFHWINHLSSDKNVQLKLYQVIASTIKVISS